MEEPIQIRVTGTKPMIQHNGRLANPLDIYSRELKVYTSKTRKTEDDHFQIMRIEARGGAYETPEGHLGLPTQNVWKSIHMAAKKFKLGKHVERALLFDPEVVPLEVDGAKVTVEDFLDDLDHVLHVPVVVSGRNMRARPLVPVPWAATVSFTVLDDELNVSDLRPVLARAGRLEGLGDWRPTYGTYVAEIL